MPLQPMARGVSGPQSQYPSMFQALQLARWINLTANCRILSSVASSLDFPEGEPVPVPKLASRVSRLLGLRVCHCHFRARDLGRFGSVSRWASAFADSAFGLHRATSRSLALTVLFFSECHRSGPPPPIAFAMPA